MPSPIGVAALPKWVVGDVSDLPPIDRRTNIAGFLKRAKRTRAPQQTTYGAFRPKRRGLPRAPRSAVPPWSRSVSRVCRCPIRTNVLSGDRFKSFSRRLSVLLMGRRTFSLWWGSNDKLRGERDPGVNGICDEAVGFDAFHGFAGRLEFGFSLEGDAGSDRGFGDVVLPLDVLEQALGFAFISDRGQASGLSEREECQHHARIERADEQLFGRPDVRLAHDVRSSHCREHTAPRGTPGGFGLIVKRLVGSLWLHENLRGLRSQRALALPFTPSAISYARALWL